MAKDSQLARTPVVVCITRTRLLVGIWFRVLLILHFKYHNLTHRVYHITQLWKWRFALARNMVVLLTLFLFGLVFLDFDHRFNKFSILFGFLAFLDFVWLFCLLVLRFGIILTSSLWQNLQFFRWQTVRSVSCFRGFLIRRGIWCGFRLLVWSFVHRVLCPLLLLSTLPLSWRLLLGRFLSLLRSRFLRFLSWTHYRRPVLRVGFLFLLDIILLSSWLLVERLFSPILFGTRLGVWVAGLTSLPDLTWLSLGVLDSWWFSLFDQSLEAVLLMPRISRVFFSRTHILIPLLIFSNDSHMVVVTHLVMIRDHSSCHGMKLVEVDPHFRQECRSVVRDG